MEADFTFFFNAWIDNVYVNTVNSESENIFNKPEQKTLNDNICHVYFPKMLHL